MIRTGPAPAAAPAFPADPEKDASRRVGVRPRARHATLAPLALTVSRPPPHGASHPVDHDDVEMMARVKEGDVAAFEWIVERFWGRTLLYAQHLVTEPDRAYDVAQEAFTRLWQSREVLRSSRSVGVWLLRTARNLVLSEQRKRVVRDRWALSAAEEESPRPPTPLQELEQEELRVAVQRAVQELSPRRREAFTLFHLQGLTYREIAEIMEVRPQTVANYLQAAIAELRVRLAPFFPALPARDPSPGSRPSDPN